MIGLYRGRSFISRVIQWRTWSVYSHASWIDDDNGSVYESWQPQGVRHMADIHIGHSSGTVIDMFAVDLTGEQKDGLRAWFTSHLGKPYDMWAILGFIWRKKLDDDSAWICSELIYQGFKINGIELLGSNTPAYKVSPGILSLSPLMTYVETKITQ